MSNYVKQSKTDSPDKLLQDIQAIEMRANAMHLFPAARALNNAKNALGWQIASNIAKADEASTHRDISAPSNTKRP